MLKIDKAQSILKYQTMADTNMNPMLLYLKQRIWFDISLLRAILLGKTYKYCPYYQSYLEEAIAFMEMNKANEEHIDYRGFKDFEIDKVKRNLEVMKGGPMFIEMKCIKQEQTFINFLHNMTQEETQIF